MTTVTSRLPLVVRNLTFNCFCHADASRGPASNSWVATKKPLTSFLPSRVRFALNLYDMHGAGCCVIPLLEPSFIHECRATPAALMQAGHSESCQNSPPGSLNLQIAACIESETSMRIPKFKSSRYGTPKNFPSVKIIAVSTVRQQLSHCG